MELTVRIPHSSRIATSLNVYRFRSCNMLATTGCDHYPLEISSMGIELPTRFLAEPNTQEYLVKQFKQQGPHLHGQVYTAYGILLLEESIVRAQATQVCERATNMLMRYCIEYRVRRYETANFSAVSTVSSNSTSVANHTAGNTSTERQRLIDSITLDIGLSKRVGDDSKPTKVLSQEHFKVETIKLNQNDYK